MTSTSSGFVGPSRTSTTSPTSRRRRVLLSEMLTPSVITDSWTTFMYVLATRRNLSLDREPSSSSSRPAKTLESASSVSSGAPSGASGLSAVLKKAVNSFRVTLSSEPTAAKRASLSRLLAFAWCLMTAIASFSNALTSAKSFFAANSRKRELVIAALFSFGSNCLSFTSSCRTSPLSQACRPSSRPSLSFSAASLEAAISSLPVWTTLSTESASASIAAEVSVCAFARRSVVSVSALPTVASAASTFFATAAILTCIFSFAAASFFSRSRRSALRVASMPISRATPTATFSAWNCSFFTPLPSLTMVFQIFSTVAAGSLKLNSPWAYFVTSALPITPPLAYLVKTASDVASFFCASSFFTALSLAVFALRRVESLARVVSLILFRRSASFVFASLGGMPGRSTALISVLLARMKSVQAFIFSLAGAPASSTFSAAAVTFLRSTSPSALSGSAAAFRVLPSASADSTRPSSSCRRPPAFSMASLICATRWSAVW
mmetsp:Transcript_38897/g.115296  ORF Transcript_38897/g.115296 Transcript_38897/m.115296 type:complete len:494 (+) Transcript_38897:806-2287(+)